MCDLGDRCCAGERNDNESDLRTIHKRTLFLRSSEWYLKQTATVVESLFQWAVCRLYNWNLLRWGHKTRQISFPSPRTIITAEANGREINFRAEHKRTLFVPNDSWSKRPPWSKACFNALCADCTTRTCCVEVAKHVRFSLPRMMLSAEANGHCDRKSIFSGLRTIMWGFSSQSKSTGVSLMIVFYWTFASIFSELKKPCTNETWDLLPKVALIPCLEG